MLLDFIPPRKLFNTESGSVDEARTKKRTWIVLDWIASLSTMFLV